MFIPKNDLIIFLYVWICLIGIHPSLVGGLLARGPTSRDLTAPICSDECWSHNYSFLVKMKQGAGIFARYINITSACTLLLCIFNNLRASSVLTGAILLSKELTWRWQWRRPKNSVYSDLKLPRHGKCQLEEEIGGLQKVFHKHTDSDIYSIQYTYYDIVWVHMIIYTLQHPQVPVLDWTCQSLGDSSKRLFKSSDI